MTELRTKIITELHALRGDDAEREATADRILALPEIADALKLVPVKPLNLGPSVSTGTRRADD